MDMALQSYQAGPSGFIFLVQIRAFALLTLIEISKFKYKSKNEMNSGPDNKKMSSRNWPLPYYSKRLGERSGTRKTDLLKDVRNILLFD